MSAAVLGATLALAVQSCESGADARFVLAQGELAGALHETADGYFNVGQFSIAVPAHGTAATILRQHHGATVKITIERTERREPERIQR